MNYKLKPQELEVIDRFQQQNRNAQLIREFIKWQGFGLGDVLVRYKITTDWGTNKTTRDIDNVSTQCGIPKKFRIVYKDASGIPWIKQLSVRGGLGNKLYCLADFSIGQYEFEIDPLYADSILLGTTYDPRQEYRLMRKENPSYGGNKKKAKEH